MEILARYLQGGLSNVVTSLEGPELDSDLKNYEEILRRNRSNLLHTHFIDGKKRADTQLQVLYVTTEDRALAEDIRNASKDEIFRRIAEKLLLLTDEETREPLSSRFGAIKAQPSKVKKETLVLLYNEIVEELQNQETQEEIKAPRGTPLVVQTEDNNKYDPHALACLLPREMERIPEALREVQIFSKSQRKKYTLEDVKGQQIGRIQHFLNVQLHGLLRCGKITRIEGEINGEPTITSRPSSTQKFSRYKQAGGGAFIPATLLVEGPQRYKEFVLERIRFTLPECENVEDMHVECLK